ncbi:CDP-glycerol glycerophosphotransferase family protein [Vibrio vulnificus]|nr:CDP-glycerol glycerophosphotransferase family protein [Vibrio vulnificus]
MTKKLIKLISQLIVDILRVVIKFFYKKNVVLISSHFGFTGEAKYVYFNLIETKCCDKIFWVYYKDKPNIDSSHVLKKRTISYFFYLVVSKYIVVSHRLADVSYIKPKDCLLINVWHGEPLKKIGYDSEIEKEWIESQSYKYGYTEYDTWDFISVNNDRFRHKMLSATKIDGSKVVCVPSMLHSRLSKKRVKPEGLNKNKILYIPTFRPYPYNFDLMESKLLISYIEKNNIDFDIKFHPMYPVEKKVKSENVNILPSGIDINEIYDFYDLIISDYSSAIFDAEAVGIPSLLYVPDFIQYKNTIGGFYDKFEDLSFVLGVASNEKDLVAKLNFILSTKEHILNYDSSLKSSANQVCYISSVVSAKN